MTATDGATIPSQARWRPLPTVERRILGVLVEKAKTTPSAYPMTLNAIITGCNQKSNRDPMMDVSEEVVDRALENLRQMGAVGIVQGLGRVDKYRHYLYEWLGVEKEELSIMAELLLRGPQTEGELRAHVSRMDPIPDLAALRQHLDRLTEKGLIVHLTPPGRGHTVAHNLYPEAELAQIKKRYAAIPIQEPAGVAGEVSADPSPRATVSAPIVPSQSAAASGARMANASLSQELATLRKEVEELRNTVLQLAQDLDHIKQELGG